MDKDEARELALARVRELRELSWAELRERYLDRDETVEVAARPGRSIRLETQVFWDARRRRTYA